MDVNELLVILLNLDEKQHILTCTALMYIVGCIVFVVLLFMPAIYGRYTSFGGAMYNVGVPAKVAWVLQEAPAFLIPFLSLLFTHFKWIGPAYNLNQLVVLLCFMMHYFQRSFIYPFLMVGGKPTPLYVMSLALIFCSVNGYMQARGVVYFTTGVLDATTVVRLTIGLLFFFAGFAVNLHSDHILRNLRNPGETGYRIPQGGFFELVSCANYFGEMVEWFGFALASWSIVGFAFSFFTVANLLPRALSHHKWYLVKFEDYPKERKAVIPYIL